MKALRAAVAVGVSLMGSLSPVALGPVSAQPYGGSEYGGRERDYGSRDRDYGSRERDYGSRDRDYGSRDRDYGSRDRGYGGGREAGFDADEYLRCNPDVRRAIASGQMKSAAAHYKAFGRREGRRLSC